MLGSIQQWRHCIASRINLIADEVATSSNVSCCYHTGELVVVAFTSRVSVNSHLRVYATAAAQGCRTFPPWSFLLRHPRFGHDYLYTKKPTRPIRIFPTLTYVNPELISWARLPRLNSGNQGDECLRGNVQRGISGSPAQHENDGLAISCRQRSIAPPTTTVRPHCHRYQGRRDCLYVISRDDVYWTCLSWFLLAIIIDRTRSSVVCNFGRVCLSVCQMITFDSLDVESLHLHIRYISREYGSSSYMKVIGSRSRSQEQKVENSYSRNVKLCLAITSAL